MTIGNIIMVAWFVLVVVFVILLKIFDASSKNYARYCIQFLEGIIDIMFYIIPFMLLVGIILSGLGI